LEAHSDTVAVTLTGTAALPFAKRFDLLHHFPLKIRNHEPGSIVHFMQIMGCSQMLWRPVRPAVATVHDLGVLVCEEDRLLFPNRLDRWILDVQLAGLKRMDLLIADSEFTRQSLVELMGIPKERVHVIYPGVQHDHFHPIPDAQVQLARHYVRNGRRHDFDLLYVGSELPRKNLGTVLEALAVLKQNGINARLVKVGGSGGERWRQRFEAAIARWKLDEDVLIIGKVPEQDLPLFYNAADVFVTASLLEGFGLPVVEAMACGLPVICSSAGALPEIAGGAAEFTESDDAHELATVLEAVLRSEVKRISMHECGVARAREFTWFRASDQLMDVYRQLA
jgi:glycosyltransferase involved in cell wall biosynthesis